MKIGDTLLEINKINEADKAYKRANEYLLEVLKYSKKMSDDYYLLYERNKGLLYERIGDLNAKQDNLSEAAKWFLDSASIYEKLSEKYPENISYKL